MSAAYKREAAGSGKTVWAKTARFLWLDAGDNLKVLYEVTYFWVL